MKSFPKTLGCFATVAILLCIPQAFGQGLTALYRFAETNASQPAADSSANHLDGLYEGGVTPGQPGPLTSGPDTNSAAFDGFTGDVFVQGDPRLESADLTIEFWMNLNDVDATYGFPLSRGIPNNPWAIQIDPVTQTTDPRQISWIVGNRQINTPAIVQPDVWQHVAIVQSGGHAGVFVNGQMAVLGGVNAITVPTTNASILIGRRNDGFFMNGSMDNVAIFNTALSPDQILSDVANGVTAGESNLVALWNFDEASTASPAADSSGNGYNGTYTGGMTMAPSFSNVLGNAAQFDGTSGYVVVPPNPAFTLLSMTIEFWINIAGSSYTNYNMPITRSIVGGPANNLPWTVQLNPTSSATNSRTIAWIASGSQITATAALPPDSWHHVAITQTGTGAQIYVDGQPVASGTIHPLENPLYIGKRADGYNFDGSLADVAVFNVARSQNQIQNDMSNGVAAGPASPGIFIYQEPQPLTLQPTMVGVFTVAATTTGANPSLFGYQWRRNGGNIAGATKTTYTTPSLTLADNGAPFDCVVSYPGLANATSAVATVSVVLPGLVALWKFDEDPSGGVAADSSGNGNSGTYNGNCLSAPGVYASENAVLLDGSSAYVDFPPSTNFNLVNLSIEFWMNLTGSNLNYMMPFGRKNDNTPWNIQINPVTAATALRSLNWIAGGSQIATPAMITPNAWHHVAATQLGTAAAVYIDGVLEAQGTVGALPQTLYDIYAGKRQDGYYFQGLIDDAAIYNFPLTPNQIQDQMQHGASASLVTPIAFGAVTPPFSTAVQPGLTASFSTTPNAVGLDPTLFTYQWQKGGVNIGGATGSAYTTPPVLLSDNNEHFTCVVSYPGAPSVISSAAILTVRTPNLVGLWKFDESDITKPAADSSGFGDNGAYQGNCQLLPGMFGSAVSLDGSADDYVDIPSSTNFDLPDQTLEFWMNMSGSNVNYMMPVTRGINNPWTFQIQPGSINGTRTMYWINGSGNISTSVTPNVWHHVAATQHGGTAAIYIDGNLTAQGTTGPIPVPSTQDIFVGKRPDGYPFTGLIDDLALFDMALSQLQIADQMQHGASANLLPAIPVLLGIQQTGVNIQISWPAALTGFKLQQNSSLANSAGWTDVPGGTSSPVTLSAPPSATFYRLKK